MNYFICFFHLCVGSYIQYVFHETYREQHHVDIAVITYYAVGTLISCTLLIFVPKAFFPWIYLLFMGIFPLFLYLKQKECISSLLVYYGLFIAALVCFSVINYFASYMNGTSFSFLFLITKLLYPIFSIWIVLYLRKRNKLREYAYSVIIAGAILIVIFITLWLNEKNSQGILILLLCLLALFRIAYCMEISKNNVLDLTVQLYTDKQNKERYESTVKENQLLMQQLHDMKKHLQIIGMIDTKEKDFLSYKEEIENKIGDILYHKQSENVLIDRILQTYRLQFEKAKIQCNIEVDPIDFSFMDVIDVSAILANILDNAIESCIQCEERFILLKIKQQKDFIIIKMKNSCQRINQKNGVLKTSKEDSLYHGYGMQNVAMIAKKYNGYLQYHFDEENHVFVTSVMVQPNH